MKTSLSSRSFGSCHVRLKYCPRYVIVLLATVAFAACHQLTDIDAPDLVDPSALDNASGADARYAGAIHDFASAFLDQVLQTGLLADEFQDVAKNPASSDRRIILPVNRYPFVGMSTARISALRAIATLEAAAQSPTRRVGELFALVGFLEVMYAENLCAPLPIAILEDGIPTAAPPLTRSQLLDHAMAMFDSAADHAGDDDAIIDLAHIGRGRALLLEGDVQEAANEVAAVPTTFEYQIPYSASVPGQTNEVYASIALDRYTSVADREGMNGLAFVSGTDERIAAEAIGTSEAGLPLYNFAKNAGLDSPITLASGIEAALMRAEAALALDDVGHWAGILDSLRTGAGSTPLPLLPDDSTSSASDSLRLNVLFHERAFWLFGTGHRQGDLRRLIGQYGRDPESVFPTGTYPSVSGVVYGSAVAFTPSGEESNPDYQVCTDTGA